MHTKAKFFKPLIGLGAFILTVVWAGPAQAQRDDNYRPYTQWDTDNNYELTREEFYTGVKDTGVFDAWDEDDNGSLDKNELGTGIYKKWERSGENFKTRDQARSAVWSRYYYGNFNDWDKNGDGTITNEEYNERIGREKEFKMHKIMDGNQDGRIEKKEFWSTVFSMWDEDSSGYLTQEEYDPDEFESWFL